eukprot:794177-Amphidinium_carterae.1
MKSIDMRRNCRAVGIRGKAFRFKAVSNRMHFASLIECRALWKACELFSSMLIVKFNTFARCLDCGRQTAR